MKKACIILGAGGSSDVHDGTSPIERGEMRPPLARDLFDLTTNPNFFEILQNYPGAQLLASLLTSKVDSGAFRIEEELRKYAYHKDERLRAAYKHVPPYLRDLIFRCSRSYTRVPGSYVQLATEMLAENAHEVLFLVLNYDDLLERALEILDTTWRFQSIEDYVREEHQAKIVKMHGSTNWFRQFTPSKTLGWNELVYKLDVFQRPPDGGIVVFDFWHRGEFPLQSHQHEGQWLYPLVTAPLAGKDVTAAVCPAKHIELARKFLGECEKFLIIGTSGLDEDLLDLLGSSVPPSTHATIQVVDQSYKAADQTLTRFEEAVRAFRGRRITPPGYLYAEGFRNYVSSEEFKSFAKI